MQTSSDGMPVRRGVHQDVAAQMVRPQTGQNLLVQVRHHHAGAHGSLWGLSLAAFVRTLKSHAL